MDTDTVKTSTKFFKNTLPSNIIFTKDGASTSDKKVEKLARELNIHYRACIGSLIYLLSTRVDMHKLEKLSSNPGKVHFEGLVRLFRYVSDNKNLGLKYYADMNDAPLSDLLRQARINIENQLMAFPDSSWKYCPYTGRSKVENIIFIKVGQLTTTHMF